MTTTALYTLDSIWQSTQAAAAGTAPTVITEGLELSGVSGFRVIVSAESTRPLSGAGTLYCYGWDKDIAAWIRNPDLDLTLTASHAGVRRVAFPDQAVFVPWGRIYYYPTGVTISGGTNVDIQVVAWRG